MIKNLLEKFKTDYKDYLKNHIVTNIFLLITIILIIFHDNTETANKLLVFSISTSIFTLFTECFTKKRTPLYIVSIILGLLIGAFSYNDACTRIIIGTLATTIIGIIYLMMKNSKTTSDKYITQAFTNLFKIGIMGIIINIGIMLVVGLFSALIYELDYDVFTKLEFIIILTYFIPAGIISLEKIEKENTKYIYVINNYILLPLVTLATTIFYLYIIKLIITLKLPETSIFVPITELLIFAIPTALMVLSYEEKNIFNKIADKLRYLFIPLIVLQTYALILRIKDYSITSERYAAIILLIILISSVFLLIKEKGKKIMYVLIPCMILTVISTIPPYINMEEFPNYMQIKRLTKIMPEDTKFEELTPKEKQEVLSIVYYIHDEKYYPSYIDRDKLINKSYNAPTVTSIYYSKEKEIIDISKYKSMEFYESRINNFKIEINDKYYDIKDYIDGINDYYIKNNDVDKYMEENNIINVSEEIDFYITNLSLSYSKNYLRLEGYILYKGE